MIMGDRGGLLPIFIIEPQSSHYECFNTFKTS
jgi:hypothetical protein